MKLPHWLIILAACVLAAVPVLASDLTGKYAVIGPVLLAAAGTARELLKNQDPPAGAP
jgi:hypothetical protein